MISEKTASLTMNVSEGLEGIEKAPSARMESFLKEWSFWEESFLKDFKVMDKFTLQFFVLF